MLYCDNTFAVVIGGDFTAKVSTSSVVFFHMWLFLLIFAFFLFLISLKICVWSIEAGVIEPVVLEGHVRLIFPEVKERESVCV